MPLVVCPFVINFKTIIVTSLMGTALYWFMAQSEDIQREPDEEERLCEQSVMLRFTPFFHQ